MYRNTLLLVFLACSLGTSPRAFGQNLSFGGVAGTNLTEDFRKRIDPDNTLLLDSESKSFIVGAMMEVELHDNLSVEVNALRRSLHYTDYATIFPDGFVFDRRNTVNTWEFPLLVKYKFPGSTVRPFVALGPSFRTVSNKNFSAPSNHGITAAAGAEMRLGRLKIAPVLRYTRWAADPGFPYIPTIPNQVELLVGVSYPSTSVSRRAFGRKLWLGVVAGVGLTGDFPPEGVTRVSDSQHSYIVGLMGELELSKRWALEVNGLYRPLQISAGQSVVLTWEVPVLVKHKFSARVLNPFVALGPSLRASGNRNGRRPSPYGITLAGGVEMRLRRFRIEPTVRYTRWAADRGRNGGRRPMAESTIPNQVELLVGFSF